MPTILCGNDRVINVVTTTATQQVPVLDANGDPVLDENENPVTEAQEVTTRERQVIDGARVTMFGITLDWALEDIPADKLDDLLGEYFTTITANTGLWRAMSDARGPAWITGDWPDLVRRLAGFYGCGTTALPGYLMDGGGLT